MVNPGQRSLLLARWAASFSGWQNVTSLAGHGLNQAPSPKFLDCPADSLPGHASVQLDKFRLCRKPGLRLQPAVLDLRGDVICYQHVHEVAPATREAARRVVIMASLPRHTENHRHPSSNPTRRLTLTPAGVFREYPQRYAHVCGQPGDRGVTLLKAISD